MVMRGLHTDWQTLKMKNKILLSLIFSIFLISFASASIDFLGEFTQNTCITIIQTCTTCTYNNFTSVVLPQNSTQLLGEIAMTKTGSTYTYSFCNTSYLGEYIINGHGDDNGIDAPWNYKLTISPNGETIDPVQISIYIIFLLICLTIAFFSIRMVKNNEYEKDKLDYANMYERRKVSELSFYLRLLKRKMWIVGVFGCYLSIVLFVSILTQLVYNLGLTDLYSILSNLIQVLLWGLIPFCIFWIGYIILFLYKSTEQAMRYQFGVGAVK